MKNILLILAIAIISLSCENEAPVDYVIFSGKIANKTADHIVVANNSNTIRDTITVSENGTFLDSLKINSGVYLITDGTVYLRAYLEQASNLNITFDTKDFHNTMSFSGEGATINNYLQAKSNKERELMGNRDSLYKLDEAAFKSKANEIQTALKHFLEVQPDISEVYKMKEERNIGYEHILRLKGYERFHAHITKNSNFKISSEFLPKMNDFDYENAVDFIFSGAYNKLVSNHYRDISKELALSKNLEEDIAYLTVISKLPNQSMKNDMLYDDAMHGISNASNLEDYYDIFINSSTDKENNETITKSYQKLKAIAKGKPSPKFYDYENNDGSKISLDDLKGKYVYIDVWATWCGPCKREFPALKELEKVYHNKNIKFLGISIDKSADYDKWKKMIVDESLVGIQLLADNAWESKFIQDYLIIGIPRFILLDPDGNIVSADAPRPSQKKLISLFDELQI